MQLLWRFLIGGSLVSLFAIVADMLRPKSFAGLFSAAPSIALGVLTLTVANNGAPYAAVEARSMSVGAVAFVVYATVASRLLVRRELPLLWVSAGGLCLWLAIAVGLATVVLAGVR